MDSLILSVSDSFGFGDCFRIYPEYEVDLNKDMVNHSKRSNDSSLTFKCIGTGYVMIFSKIMIQYLAKQLQYLGIEIEYYV